MSINILYPVLYTAVATWHDLFLKHKITFNKGEIQVGKKLLTIFILVVMVFDKTGYDTDRFNKNGTLT